MRGHVVTSVVTVPKKMELKSVPSSFSKMELKSDPSSAAKMELKSVQDPLILELVPILVPHFSDFFSKVADEKEGRDFGGWGRGWTGGSAEQVGAMSLFIFISLIVKNEKVKCTNF